MLSLKEFVESNEMLIVAHRGASGKAPENTIAAFQVAIEEGANMIETDLQLTDDGQIVAFHDFSHFDKRDRKLFKKSFTIKNIETIDAGSWFDPKFSGERIPKLEEILEFAKDKAYLNLEIKKNSNDISKNEIKKIIKIVYDYGFEKHLMFCSFHYNLLKHINDVDSSIHIAAIKIPFDIRLPSEISKLTGCKAFICSDKEINDIISTNAEMNNIFIGVYTIDNLKQLDKVMKFNIAAIGTNYPAHIKELLSKDS